MTQLFSPNPQLIGQPAGSEPQPDAVPASRWAGTPEPLRRELAAIVGDDNVLTRISDLIRYASDASPYRQVPQVVVRPRNATDLSALMRYARTSGHHLVFRSGGTSLNGQAMTDDILVDLKTHFRGMEVRDGGRRLWSRPGVILGDAQAVLGRAGYMIGADPGSTSVCTIGGILACNSGGMRCSVERDSYHTLESATIVLPSGTIVDTTDPEANARLAAAEPELYAGLEALREEIRADKDLVALLQRKFSIRNTNGLRLDAFLDADTPVDILLKLMVSAEGTLGAITEATIRTVALPRKKAVAWVMLPDLKQAARYVHSIMQAGALACELLVAPVLKRSVGNFPQAPASWATIGDDEAALLVEVGGRDEDELAAQIAAVEDVLADAQLTAPLTFDSTPAGMSGAWQIRNGLFGLIGSGRPQGSALITEDVCFPPSDIGEASADLLDLLGEYGYPQMVMGHAAFGNLHFFLLPRLANPQDRADYARFLDDLAELVIGKYQGSLKAEHGTGINMAPFVEREWGSRAFEMMWRVKDLLDPHGILAPDVKLTRDQQIHLQNFKSFPKVEDEINDCVECGFCEPVCPSRHVTVTPRQRIVLRREMARQPEDSKLLATLHEEYQYDAIDMCAADGVCSVACPVSIDTGKVMKGLRAQQVRPGAAKVALQLAKTWGQVAGGVRLGVGAAGTVQRAVGYRGLAAVADTLRKVISPDLLPTLPGALPQAAPAHLPETFREGATAVYFPACINRIFGAPHAAEALPLPDAVVELGRRAGRPVWIPGGVGEDCCGTPWSSKGYKEGFAYQARKIAADLWEWSEHGALPIIVDAASCTHGLLEQVPSALEEQWRERFAQLRILDIVEWLRDEVAEALTFTTHFDAVAVHPTCSTTHMGINDALTDLVRLCTTDVVVPDGTSCCGTAGDRGLLHPELVESATREERRTLDARDFDAFVSDNRTCEMGLQMVAGKPYENIALFLERASRPVVTP
ncbi:FAD-binding oxidoreductase [Corynebacterium sp. 13CS0277]|uniref:FAD-binding and (Fe-S)-binding domain-containing protein n=1 Tax=Corynebacterium sp. 13CS0277 TaxID=2071994 RepID=UPI000D043D96|nr:FAD-binding and (Fe-S)-binding domain-containing protein [Corynebacterium sp. 13CS0277]PRQ12040.1 FAD-binding oxidoreductase [Corynebacterium sp. 13CS0277]